MVRGWRRLGRRSKYGQSLWLRKTCQDVTSGQELFPQDNGRSQEGDRCPAPSM